MFNASILKAALPRSDGSWLVRSTKFIALSLAIAIAYSITAKLSIDFAALPGKVTAVWLPSGLTTALVAWFGIGALPGIVLGSIAGSLPDLLTMNPPISLFHIIFLNAIFALANCLQPVVNIAVIKRLTGLKPAFSQIRSVTVFILSTPVGPAISATIGITGLCLVDCSPWESYGFSWLTWCLASTLANLLFTPPLLLWRKQSWSKLRLHWGEKSLILLLGLGLSWLVFLKGYPVQYIFMPMFIWAAVRSGGFFTSLLVSLMSAMAIFMTSRGLGPYITDSPTYSLLLLESFIAVCSVTTLVLSAAIQERKSTEVVLEKALASLEQQVSERTAELLTEIS
jgi:integral membrane sensor domain MASE1